MSTVHEYVSAAAMMFRAAFSTDGVHWTWGGTWTVAAGAAPRIGLVAHGGADPAATAVFDHLRVYRP